METLFVIQRRGVVAVVAVVVVHLFHFNHSEERKGEEEGGGERFYVRDLVVVQTY